jgi:hypothetical protein
MKLQEWAHWAEIVSSVAVVGTLLFLIREVRGNTQALDRQITMDRVSTVNNPFFTAPELASILVKIKAVDGPLPGPKAYAERYPLTPEEAVLWDRHLTLLWMGLEADYRYGETGGEVEAWVRDLLTHADNRLYWEANRMWHGPEFRALVDRIAAETG